jgi:hypothetical protein
MEHEWNEHIEKLLRTWISQLILLEKEHYKLGYKNKRWNMIFGIINLMLLSGITASTLGYIIGQYHLAVFIFQLILEIISIFTSGLEKYNEYPSQSEKHFQSSDQYGALSRFIHSTLTMNRRDRLHATQFMKSIQQQFYEIKRSSPDIYYKDYNNTINDTIEILSKKSVSVEIVPDITHREEPHSFDNIQESCVFRETILKEHNKEDENARKKLQYEIDRLDENAV